MLHIINKLRDLTYQKTKIKRKKKRRGSQKSKANQKKRSQIIDDIEKDCEPIYLMDDFKSYNNKSWEEIKGKYISTTTAERVKTNYNSRNEETNLVGERNSSKFKINKQSYKHEDLQEFLRQTNREHNKAARVIQKYWRSKIDSL